MKLITRIAALTVLTIIFASCSKTNVIPETGTFANTYAFTDTLQWIKNQPTTLTTKVVPMSKTVTNTDYMSFANYISNVNFQNIIGSAIIVNGLPKGVELDNVTISVNGDKYLVNNGKLTGTGATLTYAGATDLAFLSKNYASLQSSKSLSIYVTFTPASLVASNVSNNVTLQLSYAAIYTYSK